LNDDEEIHKLGEVLRAAREARGVDLARVERDTKIRTRYLSALERGEYRELPGAVYTKGFLRNYGAYLGLDSEYLIDLYRLESAAPTVERPMVPTPPRPIAARRSRAFVITPGAVVAAVLTVAIGIFVVYLVGEFVTFARTPELRITDPAGDLSAYHGDAYTLTGVTEPNSRVKVDGLRENPTVTADAQGNFSIEIMLVPGRNVITLVASDPLTGRDSPPTQRTINVVDETASPTPGGGILAITEPAEGAHLSGSVDLRGTAAPGTALRVSASFVGPAPATFRVESLGGDQVPLPTRQPHAPPATDVTAGAAGTWQADLRLPAGSWDVSVAPAGGGDAVTRRVTVGQRDGLTGSLQVIDNASYVELDQDGRPKRGVSGQIVRPGTTIRLQASSQLRIRVGNAGAVRLTINGVALGPMGDSGAVVEWEITRL
jgi:transcriptional regulator with XRE-family HTH domain